MNRQALGAAPQQIPMAVGNPIPAFLDPNNPNGVRADWFNYSAQWSALAQNASSTQNINIQTDSDFWCLKVDYYADNNTADPTWQTFQIPNVTVVMTDTGSGRNLSDNGIPLTSFAGTPGLPVYLPAPRKFSAGSTFSLTATNNGITAITYNFWLVFSGVKVFR